MALELCADSAYLYAEHFMMIASCCFLAVEPEDLKKLGSTLNALSNEKSKQQKVRQRSVFV